MPSSNKSRIVAPSGGTCLTPRKVILIIFTTFIILYISISVWLLQGIEWSNEDNSNSKNNLLFFKRMNNTNDSVKNQQVSSFMSLHQREHNQILDKNENRKDTTFEFIPRLEEQVIQKHKDKDKDKDNDKDKGNKKILFDIPMTENYYSWLNVTLHLASKSPTDLLTFLETYDPYQVRTFDSLLIQKEIQLQRSLTREELMDLFPCPIQGERITIPSFINDTKSTLFRENINTHTKKNNGYFLFFQHLRKAGGTFFCSLAEKNIDVQYIPSYYCMPDYKWSDYQKAGYLHSYTNAQIIQYQQVEEWKIIGNEWEPLRIQGYDLDSHLRLPAIFATSFRKPLHRALSQFRFECIEDRGCKIKNVTQWWQVEGRPLNNVYLSTFADIQQLYGYYHVCHDNTLEAIEKRRQYIDRAMNVLSQFHLILIMEWLTYSKPLLQSVLGFQHTDSVTQRVRPHLNQAPRPGNHIHNENNNNNNNNLGAAGIQLDGISWEPKDYLDSYTYQTMSEDLALDTLLNDVARRIFLERTVCMNVAKE